MDKRQKKYEEFLKETQRESFQRCKKYEAERSILAMLCKDGSSTAYRDVAKLIAEERLTPPVYIYDQDTITPFLKKAFDLVITSYIPDWKPLTVGEVQKIFEEAFSSNDLALAAADYLIQAAKQYKGMAIDTENNSSNKTAASNSYRNLVERFDEKIVDENELNLLSTGKLNILLSDIDEKIAFIKSVGNKSSKDCKKRIAFLAKNSEIIRNVIVERIVNLDDIYFFASNYEENTPYIDLLKDGRYCSVLSNNYPAAQIASRKLPGNFTLSCVKPKEIIYKVFSEYQQPRLSTLGDAIDGA